MKNIFINIYTTDLEWKGMVEDVESLVLRTSFNEIVNSELVVKKTAQGIEELQIGRILVINHRPRNRRYYSRNDWLIRRSNMDI